MSLMPLTIGFSGPAGAGKSTAATYLCARHGFTRVRFAGPLKAMMVALGCTAEEVDGALKETPCALLGGRTPRQAMQWLGTEWGRDLIAPDLWTRAWEHAARGLPRVVADDVRFANEAGLIRARGGLVVRLEADGAGALSGAEHSSERPDFEPDLVIVNPMDARMFAALDDIVARLA